METARRGTLGQKEGRGFARTESVARWSTEGQKAYKGGAARLGSNFCTMGRDTLFISTVGNTTYDRGSTTLTGARPQHHSSDEIFPSHAQEIIQQNRAGQDVMG